MTTNRDLERRLAEHFIGEAPNRAPAWILPSALTTIETTRQRRGLIAPWRFPNMQIYAKVAAALAVVAIGVLALWQLGGPGQIATPTAVPSPSPTAAPGPSATSAPTPRTETAGLFVPPFDYTVPGTPEFDFGTRNLTYFEIRVPDWGDAGHPGGLIVQTIGGGKADPCDEGSAATTIEPGATAVFDYLRSIPQLVVTNEAAATVGDIPARQATVVATTDAACPGLSVWVEATESFIDGTPLRLISFDVAGEHRTITIFGEAENEGWAAMADAIVDSFVFPEASASPGSS